jgi:hypothetical protein
LKSNTAPSSADMVYLPFVLVAVPLSEPLILTDTPGKGRLVSSVTIPVICLAALDTIFFAEAFEIKGFSKTSKNNTGIKKNLLKRFGIIFLFILLKLIVERNDFKPWTAFELFDN